LILIAPKIVDTDRSNILSVADLVFSREECTEIERLLNIEDINLEEDKKLRDFIEKFNKAINEVPIETFIKIYDRLNVYTYEDIVLKKPYENALSTLLQYLNLPSDLSIRKDFWVNLIEYKPLFFMIEPVPLYEIFAIEKRSNVSLDTMRSIFIFFETHKIPFYFATFLLQCFDYMKVVVDEAIFCNEEKSIAFEVEDNPRIDSIINSITKNKTISFNQYSLERFLAIIDAQTGPEYENFGRDYMEKFLKLLKNFSKYLNLYYLKDSPLIIYIKIPECEKRFVFLIAPSISENETEE
jgi:hypothetical protein